MTPEAIAKMVRELAGKLSNHEISTPDENYDRGDIYDRYLIALLGNPSLTVLAKVPPASLIEYIVTIIDGLDLPPYGHVPFIRALLGNPYIATIR